METISPANTGTTVANSVEKKKKSKVYWTQDTERAVKDFLNLDIVYLERKLDKYLIQRGELDETIDDGYVAELEYRIEDAYSPETQARKEKIFRDDIEKPLYRLVENIIFTYKLFSHDVDVKTLQKLCVTHLYLKFANFDPDKGAKSFSYYGTVAKHYLQNRKKDLDDLKSVNLSWEDHKEETERQESFEMDAAVEQDEVFEFFEHIHDVMEGELDKKNISPNDVKVINAILKIMENQEAYEDGKYAKQSIRHAILDDTKLESREVTYSLSRIKAIYDSKKAEYHRKKSE